MASIQDRLKSLNYYQLTMYKDKLKDEMDILNNLDAGTVGRRFRQKYKALFATQRLIHKVEDLMETKNISNDETLKELHDWREAKKIKEQKKLTKK